MILDGLLCFTGTLNGATGTVGVAGTRNDAPTAIGTTPSSNAIDLGIVGLPTFASGGGARDIGIGDDPAMKLLVQVATAFTGTTGTLQIALAGAQDNGSGAPGAFSTWYTTPAYSLTQLIVGARLMDMDMPRPPLDQPIPRYLELQYIIATAVMTGGALQGFIVLDRHDLPEQSNAVLGGYPVGITVAN